jgi:hypothetical protein
MAFCIAALCVDWLSQESSPLIASGVTSMLGFRRQHAMQAVPNGMQLTPVDGGAFCAAAKIKLFYRLNKPA